jgi:hypothetical protein
MESPLVAQEYLLQKFAGKGGWTYAAIPQVLQDKNAPFGWVKVKGSIDDYPIKSYHLMPFGNGQLFLPVKAEIRKKISKEAGDYVKVILYADRDPLEIPEELLACLDDDAEAYQRFMDYPESEQKAFIDWINSARTRVKREDRVASTLNKLAAGQRLRDK